MNRNFKNPYMKRGRGYNKKKMIRARQSDKSKRMQKLANAAEKKSKIVTVQKRLELPGISRRIFNMWPDQILASTRTVIKFTTTPNYMAPFSTLPATTPTMTDSMQTIQTNGATNSGCYFRFNICEWRNPIVQYPQDTAFYGTTATTTLPVGLADLCTRYRLYRLEGQKIQLNLKIAQPEDSDNDYFINWMNRRYISASGSAGAAGRAEPFNPVVAADYDTWSETAGISDQNVVDAIEHKSAGVEKQTLYSKASGRKNRDIRFVMKYSRKEMTNASNRINVEGIAGQDSDDAFQSAWNYFYSTDGGGAAMKSPGYGIIEQIGMNLSGSAASSGAAEEQNAEWTPLNQTVINGTIIIDARVRLHKPSISLN